MTAGWPALDALLTALQAAPSRTGSMIATVYGDAILPRGGCLALADLLVLMRRLGVSEGVVRTAVSRLARDGVLHGRRAGRHSAYALTDAARSEFLAAAPQIYGAAAAAWDGRLRLAFPETGADRAALESAGFALLAPGVLMSSAAAPEGVPWLEAAGPPQTLRLLASRAWPLERLGQWYTEFMALFAGLNPVPAVMPLDAMAARTVLIHAWRRIALRDPRLPPALLPQDWSGNRARDFCASLYGSLAASSASWLDMAGCLDGRLPHGSGPAHHFHDPSRS